MILEAPLVSESDKSPVLLDFPTPLGQFIQFEIVETPVLPEKLALKYPNIRTFTGKGVDNPNDRISVTLNKNTVKVLMLSQIGNIYISKNTDGNENYSVTFNEVDLMKDQTIIPTTMNCGFEDIINKKSKHKNARLFYQQYIEVSEYAKQIQRYCNVFSTDYLLLIDYEDFKGDVAGTVDLVYDFLKVSTEFAADVNTKHNTFTMPKNKWIRFIYSFVFLRKILTFIFPKSLVENIKGLLFKVDKKPKLLEETRNQLKQFFSDDVRELGRVLGKDYSKWTK